MTRFLSLTGVLILLTNLAISQDSYGVKGGINLANQHKSISVSQTGNIKEHTTPFIGYQLGGFYKMALGSGLTFSPEINFSVIGSSRELIDTQWERHQTHEKAGYIEIPLTLQYKMHQFYIGAGPAVSFHLFSKITNFENRSFKLHNYKQVDVAGNLLLGYEITPKLALNIGYSHGLTNAFKDPGYAIRKNKFVDLVMLDTLK